MPAKAASASSKRQEQLSTVAAIKAHCGPVAFKYSDVQLLRLVANVGSVGLACDALCMIPQPKCLKSLMAEVKVQA